MDSAEICPVQAGSGRGFALGRASWSLKGLQDTEQLQKEGRGREERGCYSAFTLGQVPPGACVLRSLASFAATKAWGEPIPCLRSGDCDCAHFVDRKLRLGEMD